MSEASLRESPSVELLIGQAADEFSQRLQDGEKPTIEEYAERYPQIAAVLRQVLPALLVIGSSATGAAAKAEEESAHYADGEGCLGDFRLIRRIGQGGMGIVYEAEQISLGRRVALKVLPFAGALDARQLQRFKNEAQAAASLHHTNIVPIHAVGSERGVHYYAMQYIDGEPLSAIVQALRRHRGLENEEPSQRAADDHQAATASVKPDAAGPGPSAETEPELRAGLPTRLSVTGSGFFRTVAQLGEQGALALDHAHQRGIVHRDVKPANLLLDGDGTLWVTDFGLAQVQSDTRLTLTGDLVGTLRYMSPEQALAKRVVVDHRTDIYSLGATLYELLTLEAAFPGKDREEILRQLAFDEPKPPRRLNRAVPAELETIVLKALEKNPLDRYATAREMAEDLRRFVEDKPIQARRPTVRQRLARWGRRHRAIVPASVAILVLTTAGTTTAALWIAHERNLGETHRQQAVLERDRANREAAIAEAVNEFLNDVLARADPRNTRDPDRKLRAVLDDAAQQIAGKFADQPLVEARLQQTLANTYLSLGIYKQAERHAVRANELTARVLEPDDPRALESASILATVYRNLGRLEDARKLHEKTLALRLQRLGPEHPDTRKSMDNLGLVLHNLGRLTEARELYDRLLALQRQTLGPEHADTLRAMGNLALVLDDLWELEDARKLAEDVRAGRQRILGPDHPYTLIAMKNLGTILFHDGQLAEAQKLLEQTLELQQRTLRPLHPSTLGTMNNLAWALCVSPLSPPDQCGRAVQLAKEVVKHMPRDGSNWNTLGVASYRSGDWPGALAALKRSEELDRGLDVGQNGLFQAMAYWKLGDKQQAQKRYDHAVTWMEKKEPKNRELMRFRREAEELMGLGTPAVSR